MTKIDPIGKPMKHAAEPQVLEKSNGELWFTRWGRSERVKSAEVVDCNSCEDGTVYHFVSLDTEERVYCECDTCTYFVEFPIE